MNARPGHETRDLPPRWVTLAVVGLLLLIPLGALIGWALVAGFGRPAAPPNPFERAAAQPPAPRLEVDARADRMAIDARAQAHLDGYGWTDQAAGLARIPIERAMALQAQQGWPDADGGPANAMAASNATSATNSAATNAAPANAAVGPEPAQ